VRLLGDQVLDAPAQLRGAPLIKPLHDAAAKG
jgi:hypothetical protein